MDMWTEYLRKYTHVFWSEWVTSVNMYRGLPPWRGLGVYAKKFSTVGFYSFVVEEI